MQSNTRKYIKAMLALFCAMFLVLCVYLVYIVGAYGTRWFTSPYNSRVQAQKSNVQAGRIADRNGELLAYTADSGERFYSTDRARRRAICHVVGDSYGQTVGAESMFAKYLLGFDQDVADRFVETLSSGVRMGSSVMLTIDAKLCDYAYDLMNDYWGSVVLLNYKTGEILCSVSQPTFDPNYMEDYIEGRKELAASAMVDRVTMGKYTPGSTFKTVTLIAALRYLPGVTERTFDCDGALVFDRETGKYLPDVAVDDSDFTQSTTQSYDREKEGAEDTGAEPDTVQKYSIVRDYQSQYHGEITLFEAYTKSCNHVFAQLALEVGAAKMAQTARELCIGDEFLFDDLLLYTSSYAKPDTQLNLAWSGVGQYKDLMTPMQMCMLTAAVANDGVMMQPRLLSKVVTKNNYVRFTQSSKTYKTILSAAEAEIVQQAMLGTIKSGTGTSAAVKGYAVGGKTGTAEISSNKTVNTHAWFTGFVQDDEHPLAVCVILEQAGGGGSKAAPLAGKLLSKAISLGY